MPRLTRLPAEGSSLYFSHLSRAQVDFLMAITMSYPHLHAFELSIFGCLFIYSFYGGGGESGSHVNPAGFRLAMEQGWP